MREGLVTGGVGFSYTLSPTLCCPLTQELREIDAQRCLYMNICILIYNGEMKWTKGLIAT